MKIRRRATRRSLPLLLLLAALLVLPGCPGGGGDGTAGDTLTRREKDSIVVRSGLPGSGAVGNALEAVDSINARAARHDSIAANR